MEYILKSSQMFYGLSIRDIRSLAFGFAEKMEIEVPASWNEENSPGSLFLIPTCLVSRLYETTSQLVVAKAASDEPSTEHVL